MRRFINSIQIALRAKDWYGALSTALILPDICGRIEAPQLCSKDRYVDWYNRYMLKRYTTTLGPDRKPHVFLCADDCYALRCSYIHEGGQDIEEHHARKALASFHFTTPPAKGMIVHMNQKNDILQLQVDIFCIDICSAVEEWFCDVVEGNPELENRIESLITVHDSSGGVVF